jgi:hypothetical protein
VKDMASYSKLGPIPDEHFENDPAPPGTYAGRWSPEQEIRFALETMRLAGVVHEERRRRRDNRQEPRAP